MLRAMLSHIAGSSSMMETRIMEDAAFATG
jgi:hypothetical protein